jgi:hypothetical protein
MKRRTMKMIMKTTERIMMTVMMTKTTRFVDSAI